MGGEKNSNQRSKGRIIQAVKRSTILIKIGNHGKGKEGTITDNLSRENPAENRTERGGKEKGDLFWWGEPSSQKGGREKNVSAPEQQNPGKREGKGTVLLLLTKSASNHRREKERGGAVVSFLVGGRQKKRKRRGERTGPPTIGRKKKKRPLIVLPKKKEAHSIS